MSAQYVTIEVAAQAAGKTPRTIERWISKGLLSVYKIDAKTYKVSVEELRRVLSTAPRATVRRKGLDKFGPGARVIDLGARK